MLIYLYLSCLWTAQTLSFSLYSPVPYTSLWPFVDVTPVYPFALLYQGAQNNIQNPESRYVSPRQSSREGSVFLAARAHCWQLVHQCIQVLFCQADFQIVSLQHGLVPALGLFLLMKRTLCFSSLDSMWLIFVHSSSMCRCLWMAAQLSANNHCSQFCVIMWKVHDVPASRSLMKVMSNICSSTEDNTSDWPRAGLHAAARPLQPSSSARFKPLNPSPCPVICLLLHQYVSWGY